jgi:hypothetical protein
LFEARVGIPHWYIIFWKTTSAFTVDDSEDVTNFLPDLINVYNLNIELDHEKKILGNKIHQIWVC